MIPFDGEHGEMAHGFVSRCLWGSVLGDATTPVSMDPLPPINAKGGRTIPPEGWKSVYAIEVLPGECDLRDQC
jgi:acyl-coenzyme A thioesterase 13